MKTLIIILILLVIVAFLVVGLCMAAGKSTKIMEGIMDETHEEL